LTGGGVRFDQDCSSAKAGAISSNIAAQRIEVLIGLRRARGSPGLGNAQ
jgi:hypothetical protein